MSLSSSFSSETSEICLLRDENKLLRQELSQCKADKEFVWSLWQRLQVSNPDITQAISTVLERKKQEYDAKEKNLVDVISEKDAKVKKLDQQVGLLNQELSSQLERTLELQSHLEQRQLELKDCLSKVTSLQKQVNDLELRDAESASREVVRELDGLNLELKQQLQARDSELGQLRLRNAELTKADVSQREKLLNIEGLVHSLEERNDAMKSELSVQRSTCKKYESEIRKLKREADCKNAEIETLRKDLSESWHSQKKESGLLVQQTDLNQKLQALLMDTQKMLQNQEEAFVIEITEQKQTVLEQSITIANLRDKLQCVETEMAKLEEERAVENQSPDGSSAAARNNYQHDDVIWRQKLETCERKMDDLKDLLVMKNKELDALRTSHTRRLDRLRCILSSNRLMKQQLKLFHEDPVGVATKKPVSVKLRSRSQSPEKRRPKSLQKEDCDVVWNELDQLRKENKTLKAENVQLFEESDMLRIESTNSSTTIHELKCCLEQQQQEINHLEDEREKFKDESERFQEESSITKSRLDKIHLELLSLQEEDNRLQADLEISEAENRTLSSELDFLQRQEVRQKARISGLERDLINLQKKLRKRFVQHKTAKMQTTKQKIEPKPKYEVMKTFHDDQNDEWQDISECESDRSLVSDCHASSSFLTHSTVTGDSLGQSIVEQARSDGSMATENVVGVGEQTRNTSEPLPKKKLQLNNRQKQAIKQYVLSVAKDLMHLKQQTSGERSASDEPVSDLSEAAKGTQVPKTSTSKRVASLKQRVSSLLRQVEVLKNAKESILMMSEKQKKELESLQEQLNTANQRLLSSKQTTQRLTGEVDRLKAEKEMLETKMSEYTFEGSSCSGRSDQEWTGLQNRLKSASAAMSRQLEQLKQLKTDNQKQNEKIVQLTQRNDRLEQDLNNKRTLIEDYRLKLAVAEQNAEVDADLNMMLEVESKLKSLAEENYRLKTKVDCLSKRIAVVTREKFDGQGTVKKLSEEIDKKSKLLTDLQRKNAELQSTVSATEKNASSHLQRLASQTEAAVDVAQARLAYAESRVQECSSFVKMLAHSILEGLRQSRLLLNNQRVERRRKEQAAIKADPSLAQAQHRACEILNITETDLTDIMSVSSHTVDDEDDQNPKTGTKDDSKWAKKCESLLQTEGGFAVKLVDLFVEKVEERCRLSVQLSSV